MVRGYVPRGLPPVSMGRWSLRHLSDYPTDRYRYAHERMFRRHFVSTAAVALPHELLPNDLTVRGSALFEYHWSTNSSTTAMFNLCCEH